MPMNCLRCESCRVTAGYAAGECLYSCTHPRHGGMYAPRRTISDWIREPRKRITPPSWCPLKREETSDNADH